MSLKEKLAAISEAGAKRMPEEVRAKMGAATQALRESGIMDGVIKVGDTLPPFELPDVNGLAVRSDDVLAKGPMVLTVYRGHW